MKKIGLVFAGAALSVMVAFGAGAFNHTDRVEKAEAYDSSTQWYLTGEFNDWNKSDAKCHLTYASSEGNNDEFHSDYAVILKKGQKFNFVNPYDGGYNTICPADLYTNNTDFTHPADTDYLVPNSDMIVKFFFKKYNGGYWAGLYWYVYSNEKTTDDTNTCLESWCYDFVEITGTICDGTDRNNETALTAVWEDSTITSTKASNCYLAGSFNGWNASETKLNETTTSGVYKISDVFLCSTDEFKIVYNGSWYPASNVKPGSNGYYTISFNTNGNSVTHTKQSCEYLKTSFAALSSTVKAYFNSTNETPKIAAAYERYVHIINHYASLTNFASGTVSRNNAGNYLVDPVSADSTGTTMIAVLASFAAVVATAGFVFLKKKKTF